MPSLLVSVVGAVFLPVLEADFVNWDDDLHVLDNPKVQAPGTVGLLDWILTPELGYPVPVTMISYALGRWIHGPDPAGFHLVNWLLHLVNVLLVWSIARRSGFGIGWAIAAGALFGLHPVVVEPVAWVSGRKDLLVAAFLLGSMRWLVELRLRADDRMGPRWGIAALLGMAMLSKPVAALAPLVVAVFDAPGRRGPWPAALLVTLALTGTTFVLEARVGALEGGAVLGDPVARVLAGLAWHGRILLGTVDPMPKYLDPPGGPDLATIWTGVAFLGIGILVVLLALRRCPATLPGLALAIATYAPVCGIVPLSRQYADSYLYVPLAGLSLSTAALGGRLARVTQSRWIWGASLGIVVGLSLMAAFVSARQVGSWRDGVHLWAEVWQRYPDSPQVCRNLGNAHLFGRRFEPLRAAAVYRHCIDRLGQREFFLKNLAIASALGGDRDQARALVEEALGTRPDDATLRRWAERLGIAGGAAHRSDGDATFPAPP